MSTAAVTRSDHDIQTMAQNLIGFDPFSGLDSLRRDVFEGGRFRGLRDRLPMTDVYTEDDQKLAVEAHLPHFDEEDITVSVDKAVLVNQAERREHGEDKHKKS